MKRIVTVPSFFIFLLALAGCQNDIIRFCGEDPARRNCDLKIYLVNEHGDNLIASGDYDPTLFRLQVKHDGKYRLVAYSNLGNPYLYNVEKDEDSEKGEYILVPVYDGYTYTPTEQRADPNSPDIEYWTSEILMNYNYFDSRERTDTLRSVVRYQKNKDCPTDIFYLEELYINGLQVWKEGVDGDAPEWTVVR